MPKKKSLPAWRLSTSMPADKIAFDTSSAFIEQTASSRKGKRKTKAETTPPQPRALQALELGMRIKDLGYNIYLAGEANLGRTYLLKGFLSPWADTRTPPPDLLYVYNFKDPDKPRLLQLPKGSGRALKDELGTALGKIRKEIPLRYETENYVKRRNALMDEFQTTREQLVGEMESEAADEGFNLDMDEQGGLTLYPLIEGKLLSEEEFERLDPALRQKLKTRSERLMTGMAQLMRKISNEEQGLREHEQKLDRELVQEVLKEFLDPLVKRFNRKTRNEELKRYFKDLREEILANVEQFTPQENSPVQAFDFMTGQSGEDFFNRFEVNVFVDNAQAKGAPVVVEDHPTPGNLLGCIERESEMGALVTDFTLIKAGALHRANGGVLVLHTEDMMQHSTAWEGLLRALRSGQTRIEDQGEGSEQAKTKTIEPEPLPLDLKVVLVGTDETWELLLDHDDRFPKLFKVKAHLQQSVDRSAGSIRDYCLQLARIAHEAGLRPFDRGAMAGLVDHGSRLAEDQKKLSLMFPLQRELMIEASAMAEAEGKKLVDADMLRRARMARDYRANLYEEEFMEHYDRELIRVATSGHSVGRVNGLSVSWFGNYEIGLPHHIACTVGVGEGGIVDLEREAQLGGPIHTKAMMILKSYLVGQFAQNKPIMLTGSLCFEQSYAHVEGDSASGAELASLLSALGQTPVSLSLAFTGAVNQSGEVMAVGGVTRKIEGFFEVCRRKGLTGQQGVVMPLDNQDQLLLKEEVITAVQEGRFHIYPVRHIEEAMELLTGLKCGVRRKDGSFTPGSLFHKVDERLAELASLARKYAPVNGMNRWAT